MTPATAVLLAGIVAWAVWAIRRMTHRGLCDCGDHCGDAGGSGCASGCAGCSGCASAAASSSAVNAAASSPGSACCTAAEKMAASLDKL